MESLVLKVNLVPWVPKVLRAYGVRQGPQGSLVLRYFVEDFLVVCREFFLY